jgi:EAL domain-containing protein (putative c-di-GMP-specific phosphodiesterase class I)
VLTENGALTMVFQPIVTLRDNDLVGFEALARFTGPPDQPANLWFDDAVEIGRCVELELLAVAKAVRELVQLPDGAYLTVNVSPMTILDAEFLSLISNVSCSRIVAEITEHAAIDDYDRLMLSVARLRDSGMRIAIDDTGAGFASLRHILNLEPDLIKLDLTLIRGIHFDQAKQALAASLIAFAEKRGSIIVAEGIEQPEEATALIDLGVDLGQGYLLGKPGPLPAQ